MILNLDYKQFLSIDKIQHKMLHDLQQRCIEDIVVYCINQCGENVSLGIIAKQKPDSLYQVLISQPKTCCVRIAGMLQEPDANKFWGIINNYFNKEEERCM